ncbi:MAG: hypothetical protein L3J53_04995 [Proteobacteria bacterium]|nr:hypothetical protein [Pseudomonadota bacterium]
MTTKTFNIPTTSLKKGLSSIMYKFLLFFLIITNVNAVTQYENELGIIENIENAHEQVRALEYFYKKTFQPQISSQKIELYTEKQLKNIIKTFQLITFYAQNQEITQEHLKYFEVLRQKKWAETKDYEDVFGALNHSRLFQQVELFYTKYPQFNLPKPPVIQALKNKNPNDILILALDQNHKNTLITEVFKFSESVEILVVSRSGCHFSQRAANDIAADEPLTRFLKEHSKWLMHPSSRWSISSFADWNKKYPHFATKYIYRAKDFPMIKSWETPVFYFFKNGVIVEQVIGWPKEGRMQELKSYIKKHFSVSL